jgi:hypothetical protein
MIRDGCKPLVLPLFISAVMLGSTLPVFADDDRDNRRLKAEPVAFVGKAGDCGDFPFESGIPYPAGSNIVTAAWLGGMGLPDNGGPNSNPLTPTDNPNKRDPRLGLLLSKNGPSPDCSAAAAEIKGVRGLRVGTTIVLGFDYRNGGHCGAGAPRFNVVSQPPSGPETFHFVGGCSNGTPTPALQDPTEWTTVRFGPLQQFPPILAGSTIKSIDLIHDEGTDTPTVESPRGVGLAVVDNIFIDGRVIRSGSGIEPEPKHGKGSHDD